MCAAQLRSAGTGEGARRSTDSGTAGGGCPYAADVSARAGGTPALLSLLRRP